MKSLDADIELTTKALGSLHMTENFLKPSSRMVESSSECSTNKCLSIGNAAPAEDEEEEGDDVMVLEECSQQGLASVEEARLPLSQRLQLRLHCAVGHGSDAHTKSTEVKHPCQHPTAPAHSSGMENLHAIFSEESSLDLFDVSSVESPFEHRALQPKTVTTPAFNASQMGDFNIDTSLLNNLSCSSLPEGSLTVTEDASRPVDGLADEERPAATGTEAAMTDRKCNPGDDRDGVTNTFLPCDSSISLAERLKLRLREKPDSRALTGLHSITRSDY